MNELIEQYKTKKLEVEQAKTQLDQLQAELEATEEWRNLLQAKEYLNAVDSELGQFDTLIRQVAVEFFLETGNKHPANGVTVVLNKSLNYQPDHAIRWAAANNALEMLSLNKRTFEKHARAILETMPLEFVEVKEEPSVRIAKEL